MKRSAIQCVAGVVGATLVVVGVVWTCRQLTSPNQLNAAGVASEKSAASVRQIPKAGALAPLQTVRATALPASSAAPTQTSRGTVADGGTAPARVAPKSASRSTSAARNAAAPIANSATAIATAPKSPSAASGRAGSSSIRQTSGGELGLSLLESDDSAPAPEVAAASLAEDAPTAELSDLRYEDASTDVETGFQPVAEIDASTGFQPLDADATDLTAAAPNDFASPSAAPLSPLETVVSKTPTLDAALADPTCAAAPESLATLDDATPFEATAPAAPSAFPAFDELDSVAPAASAYSPVAELASTATIPATDDSFAQPLDEPSTSASTLANETFGTAVPGPVELEGPQTARIVVEKTAPEETQIDQEATIVVKIKNVGDAPARGVSLRDALPVGARFVSANPAVAPNEKGEFVWDAFDLGPQEERTFEYRLIPTQEGEFGGVATATFTASASSRTRCVKPELTVEIGVAKEATLGDNLDFEIVVSNVGSGAARDVSLLETIPDGLKHPGGSVLNNKLGTLKPGETKRLPLTLQCVAAGPTVNKLVVSAAGGIEKAVESEIKILAPNLELSSEGPATVYLERDATFRLKARNAGDASAKDVKLVAKLPVGTAFVAANNLGVYKEDARAVYWDLAELPVGSEGEIELTLKPTQMGASSLVFEGTGPNDLAAQTSQDVAIDGLPALSFSVKASPDPVEVGKEVEYVVQIVNRGTKASTNVLLQIVAPESMKIVSSDGPTTSRNISGATVFDKIREVPAKSSVSYKVRAVASVAGDCRLGFQLSSDDLQPLVKEENTRAY